MDEEIKKIFPNFSKELIKEIVANAIQQSSKSGDILMRTGQYINHTMMLIKGQLKIYREGENGGEFFMYYIQPGEACAVSMICATKSQTSQIMAKVVEGAILVTINDELIETFTNPIRLKIDSVISFTEIKKIDNITFTTL